MSRISKKGRSALLAVQDELNDLIALLGTVPELNMLNQIMGDIISPPPPEPPEASESNTPRSGKSKTKRNSDGSGGFRVGSRDRIGKAAVALGMNPRKLNKRRSWDHDLWFNGAELVDMPTVPEAVTAAVRLRLVRVARLMGMVQQREGD